jgi:acyl-CoA synthetase (AMP-forming)/AMP-acid ligase II
MAERMMEPMESREDQQATTCADTLQGFWSATEFLMRAGGPFETQEELVLGEPMQVFRNRKRHFLELLETSAALYGTREFLVFEGGPRVTFAEFRVRVLSTAEKMHRELKIRQGERIAICAKNGPGWIIAASAALTLGAVVVAMNSWWTPEDIQLALELTEPAAILIDSKGQSILPDQEQSATVADIDLFVQQIFEGGSGSRIIPDVNEDDPALILFTSGTSGRPKAAVLTHRCLIGFVQLTTFIGARAAAQAGMGADGVPLIRLAVFPLFHISGFGSFISALAFGHKTVWPAGRFDAGRIIELSENEGINMWAGASTHIARLMECPRLDRFDKSQIRQVGIGGSASTPNLIALTEHRLPHLRDTFASGYGMTESGGLVSHAPNFMLRIAEDCVGPALPTIEVRIERSDGTRATEGEIGVIYIRSPIVMKEYFGPSDAAEAGLGPNRWLRTEDYGRLEGGLLFVASRIRDLIIRGGENIFPAEVERCLERHPAVLEAAVYGRDDEEFGQVVVASVYLQPGSELSGTEMRSYCAERLAYFKVPKEVVVRSEPLPRNAVGKVLKRLLESEGSPTEM